MTTRAGWANSLLWAGGWPTSPANVDAVVAWGVAEGSDALWNPLDTTEPWPGATMFNSVGVRNYSDLRSGLAASLATIRNGHYPGVIAALAAGRDAYEVAHAVGRSPWGTGDFSSVLTVVQHDRERYYNEPIAGTPEGGDFMDRAGLITFCSGVFRANDATAQELTDLAAPTVSDRAVVLHFLDSPDGTKIKEERRIQAGLG